MHAFKSKTVHVEGYLGRDVYRKVEFGADIELEQGEDPVSAKDELLAFIDMTIADQIQQFNEEAIEDRGKFKKNEKTTDKNLHTPSLP